MRREKGREKKGTEEGGGRKEKGGRRSEVGGRRWEMAGLQ